MKKGIFDILGVSVEYTVSYKALKPIPGYVAKYAGLFCAKSDSTKAYGITEQEAIKNLLDCIINLKKVDDQIAEENNT